MMHDPTDNLQWRVREFASHLPLPRVRTQSDQQPLCRSPFEFKRLAFTCERPNDQASGLERRRNAACRLPPHITGGKKQSKVKRCLSVREHVFVMRPFLPRLHEVRQVSKG